MGTTVTANLGLIKPDVDEYVQPNLPTYPGWAVQNATNMDKIDALFRAASTTYTLNWTADTTNPTLGAGGFTEGKFVRLFPRLVLGFFRINIGGAGAAPGTGIYRFNLPTGVAAEMTMTDDSMPIGKATFFDSSAVVSSSAFLCALRPSTSNFSLKPSAGGDWSGAAPVALGQLDSVSGYFLYPTADA